jgi:hypothetical protein|tara:strand:+ start:735 stop:1031 length:297 start_codon:yes stop_codon:yes gene_type:complete
MNIIIKNGEKKRSSEEVAEMIARHNEQEATREKAEYKEKSRKLRQAAESLREGKGAFRLESVMDARTYFRHEQQNPGSMSDDAYRRELLRDNPEIDCR